jgi:bile acid:Na+ symporter, BASS family
MTLDQIISLLVSVTLIVMMIALGLRVTMGDLLDTVRNGPLLLRTLLANYVCVPLATVGLLMWFQASGPVSAGFLILAVCPGAPFAPQIVGLARGNVPVAVGMMFVLALSSVVVAPLSLYLLLPLVMENATVTLSPVRLVSNLLFLQLLPLGAGMLIRNFAPGRAARLEFPTNSVSLSLTLVSVVGIIATQYPALAAIRLQGFPGMIVLLAVSLAAGWLPGSGTNDVRRSLAVTTALRNLGLGLVIATGSFAGTSAPTAVLAYGLFGIAGTVAIACWWGRDQASGKRSVPSCCSTIANDDSLCSGISPEGMRANSSKFNTEAVP